jgi:GxxExxY protein
MIEQDELNGVTERIIGAAIEVHRALGPGLLESAYQACLRHELGLQGLAFEAEKILPVTYKGVTLDCGYRIDVVVEDLVIVELKSVSEIASIHEAQILSYMKISGCPVGLLINFNVSRLTQGIKRFRL